VILMLGIALGSCHWSCWNMLPLFHACHLPGKYNKTTLLPF